MANTKKVTVKTAKATLPANASLFTRIYHDGKDATKEANEGLVERATKRKLQSAYDDAAGRINDEQQGILGEYGKLGLMDINNINDHRAEIEALTTAMEYIAETYVELFGETINS